MELLANKNACLLQGRVLVATLHNILLTCCVAIGRRLMTNGHSSLGVQHVSILQHACPRPKHALCMVWNLAFLLLLASWPHVTFCATLLVGNEFCLVVDCDQWPFFTLHAARECIKSRMSDIDSCRVHCLGLGFSIATCFKAACLLLPSITFC